MNIETIRFMYDYNAWANDTIIHALEQLTEEDLNAKLPGASASLRDRFAHIAGAEWIWLERWKGQPPNAIPEWSKNGDLKQLAGRLLETRQERDQMIATLTNVDLERRHVYHNLKGDVHWDVRIGEMLLHVVNHSSYHRGQVASAARQMGFAPPSTDLLFFAAKK